MGFWSGFVNWAAGRRPDAATTTSLELVLELLRAPDQNWLRGTGDSNEYVLSLPDYSLNLWASVQYPDENVLLQRVVVDGTDLRRVRCDYLLCARIGLAMRAHREQQLGTVTTEQLQRVTAAANLLCQQRAAA